MSLVCSEGERPTLFRWMVAVECLPVFMRRLEASNVFWVLHEDGEGWEVEVPGTAAVDSQVREALAIEVIAKMKGWLCARGGCIAEIQPKHIVKLYTNGERKIETPLAWAIKVRELSGLTYVNDSDHEAVVKAVAPESRNQLGAEFLARWGHVVEGQYGGLSNIFERMRELDRPLIDSLGDESWRRFRDAANDPESGFGARHARKQKQVKHSDKPPSYAGNPMSFAEALLFVRTIYGQFMTRLDSGSPEGKREGD